MSGGCGSTYRRQAGLAQTNERDLPIASVTIDNLDDPPRPDLVRRAIDILERGGLVAIPTETVYGLAADATNGRAVARIFEVKGRPRFNPLISHVDGMQMARQLGVFDNRALSLAGRFWPGPLTLILPRTADCPVHPLATAGLQTIGIRIPNGPIREIIRIFGRPLAAPSANRSGRLSPTRADHVADQLGASIDLILDAGPCTVGLESTIVAVLPGQPARLLRPGGLSAVRIEETLGEALVRPGPDADIEAPGMLAGHYAPKARLRLAAESVEPDEALLAFGPELIPGNPLAIRNLSPTGDLAEAAANLFACLAELDAQGVEKVAVMPVPGDAGTLAEAINDRLRRAALDPDVAATSDEGRIDR